MPQVEHPKQASALALDVLREELALIDAQFDAIAATRDVGEREARENDLMRAIDRYLRLESEVLYPVLACKRVDHAAAAASNEGLRSAARQLVSSRAGDLSVPLAALRVSLREHREAQEHDLFPRAAHALHEEPGLAVEMQEVRSRMKGAFGV